MYTLVRLHKGILTVKADTHGQLVEERLWRAAIFPAIQFLRATGGGALYIPHRPGELG